MTIFVFLRAPGFVSKGLGNYNSDSPKLSRFQNGPPQSLSFHSESTAQFSSQLLLFRRLAS
jgi:hypothetical protein